MKKLDLGNGQFIVISDKTYNSIKESAGKESFGYLEFNQYISGCDEPNVLDVFDFDIEEFQDY